MTKPPYTLEQLNVLKPAVARDAFEQCCTASRWVDGMVAARPFTSLEQCQEVALAIWRSLDEADFLEAFEGHPKIGDITSLRQKYAHTKTLASAEQGAVHNANEQILQALASGNARYEAQNGFIFIVCATGKSAQEMLTLLESRLLNSRAQELETAATQQSLITAIRLDKLILSEDNNRHD